MNSWKLAIAGALTALAAAAFACSGSSSGIGTGCSGLAACCATLSGAEAQSCLTTVGTMGITDAECNAVLSGYQTSGICGGGGGGGSGATGCGGLSSCCPDLPVSQNPTECLAVASEGTDEACSQSLSTYQAAGYCEPDAGSTAPTASVLCLETNLGQCSIFAGSTVAEAMTSCTNLSGEVVASCPTARLLGCCVLPPLPPGYVRIGSSGCYYSEDSGVFGSSAMDQSSCSSAKGIWSSSVPAGL